jgi:CO/xanthine dehydrogenase FAD-binding subunit
MLLSTFTLHTPNKLSDALELYSKLENVRIQAGGTFLLNALKMMKRKGSKSPEHILSLSKINELKGIELKEDQLLIKAMTTIDELFESPFLRDNYSVLHTVCRNISTQPIRNMATVGGNLTCRYTWTEMPAVMIGLEATMHFMDVSGQTESLPAEEFFQQSAKTDKIFTHVTIPHNRACKIAYRRIKKTQYVDIPLLSTLIKTTIKDDQFTKTIVSINNCVSFAQRDKSLEKFLNQNKLDKTLPREALNHLTDSIYDQRSDDYKKHMFQYCLRTSIEELMQAQG